MTLGVPSWLGSCPVSMLLLRVRLYRAGHPPGVIQLASTGPVSWFPVPPYKLSGILACLNS